MNGFVQRLRGPLLALGIFAFLAYSAWSAHTPGEPRTMRDFLFFVALFGGPFLVLAYVLWSLSGLTELATAWGSCASRKGRIALIGAILGAGSAALLLLIGPFWSRLIEHEGLGALWAITGMLLAVAATLCGIIGSTKLRRSALVSVFLLPFWIFAAGLLVKGAMD